VKTDNGNLASRSDTSGGFAQHLVGILAEVHDMMKQEQIHTGLRQRQKLQPSPDPGATKTLGRDAGLPRKRALCQHIPAAAAVQGHRPLTGLTAQPFTEHVALGSQQGLARLAVQPVVKIAPQLRGGGIIGNTVEWRQLHDGQ